MTVRLVTHGTHARPTGWRVWLRQIRKAIPLADALGVLAFGLFLSAINLILLVFQLFT